MQGKGLIKSILILIIAVCVLQFSYFIPTINVEKSAEEYAQQVTGKTAENKNDMDYKIARVKYLDSMSAQEVFSIPLIKSFTYSELKKQQLGLGLDLKGGMSSVLQVDLTDFLKSLAGRNANNIEFTQALANADVAMRTSQSDFITLFADEYRKLAGENKMARLFSQTETLDNINNSSSDGEVTRVLRQKADETVNQTFERLKQRIDKLGVAQPNVTLDPNRDLILVEMPGIDNPKVAREFLTRNAKLEFWETYRSTDPGISPAFMTADRLYGNGNSAEASFRDSLVYDPTTGAVLDTIQVPDNTMAVNTGGALLNALSLNSGSFSGSVIGVADRSQKRFIDEVLSSEDVKALFPKNSRFMWSQKPTQDENGKFTNNYELYLIKTIPNSDAAPLDGSVVTRASQSLDYSGNVEVTLRMNAAGAKKWAEITTKAANEGNREIAIVLDDEVVSAPRVNQPITGGNSSITGNYTVDEAVNFASILEVGKLPAGTKIVQEMNVGPSLGKDNIDRSINSLLIGFALVIITILVYYSFGGVLALMSLLLNIFIIFGTLSSFGTVLTLSGIAGIVLTIGMAVDANVIIFERIKEELNDGKSVKQAITDGFYHSYSAIIDANVTTILTATILAYFGLGPVKGFAIVLIIGVVSSMFTAIFVTRMLIDWWVGQGRNLPFWSGISKDTFKNITFDWISKRRIAYIFSGVIIAAGIVSILTRGFDFGVDYKGGYSYTVQFTGTENVTADDLRNGLSDAFGAPPVVKQVDTENSFNITTSYLINENTPETAEKVITKLHEGIVAITKSDVALDVFKDSGAENEIHVLSSAQVGPTIASDLKRSSLYAGVFALIVVFLYILLRFSKWQYSAGAIVAVFHDSLVVLSVFSLLYGFLPFSLEIDQAFIAAILTVIGYSLNDTVIIFDRIRENLGIHVNKDKDDVINMAINSTLSRTLMTSFTTVVVVLILFLFGGASIKGFAFALLVGIVVGTYSSVFIAAPVLHDLGSDLKINVKKNN